MKKILSTLSLMLCALSGFSQTWNSLSNSQAVSWAALQDAVNTGVFAWGGTAFPTSNTNQCLYKNLATVTNYAAVTLNSSRATNDLLVKSDFTSSATNSITIYGTADNTVNWINADMTTSYNTSSMACANSKLGNDAFFSTGSSFPSGTVLYSDAGFTTTLSATYPSGYWNSTTSALAIQINSSGAIGAYYSCGGNMTIYSGPYLTGATTSNNACAINSSSSRILYYSGTLAVNTRVLLSGYTSAYISNYYKYSGGWLQLANDANGYYIAAMGTCAAPYTAYTIYNMTSYPSSINACSDTHSSTSYLYSSSGNLTTGITFYTNTAMTAVFNGYSSWWSFKSSLGNSTVVGACQINPVGVVTAVACVP